MIVINKGWLYVKICLLFSTFLLCNNTHSQVPQHTVYEAIDTEPFQNSAHHWYDIFDEGNVINPIHPQPRYKPDEITKIADNVLLYQKDNGGWPKNYDMLAILTEAQKSKLLSIKSILNTTFDNSTSYSHVEYLALVYKVKKDARYKDAALKGIDYMLASQYANGGWPQYYPVKDDYSKCITYNDDVIVGILTVFKKILDDAPQYNFVNKEIKKKVAAAYAKGLDCILKTQIIDDGKATAWCQQYDEVTLTPAWARKFEPPSICNRESAAVVSFLMSINHPSKEIIQCVQSAIKWFDDSKIKGIRVKTIPAPPIQFHYRFSKTDRVVVNDSTAPDIWTRYYEIGTHKSLFCNRDKTVVYTLDKVERERRDGYGWYTYEPKEVLEKYKSWQEKWAPEKNVLETNKR